MDAIGLIASCANIIEGVEQLYKFVKQNVHSSSSVRAQISALIPKCCACKGIIEGVKLQAELNEAEHISGLFVLEHVIEPIRALEDAIEMMTGKLKSLPSHVVFGKVFGSGIDKCLKTFNDTLHVLQLALQDDQYTIAPNTQKHLQDLKADTQSLTAITSQLRNGISDLNATQLRSISMQEAERKESRSREARSWLSNLDVEQLYQSLAEKAHPVTGSWFIEGPFRQWLQADEKPTRVLWLHGSSGTGKTTLVTSTITYMLNQRKTTALTYFICSSSLSETRISNNLLRSILVQLCDQKPELWEDICAWRDELATQHRGLRWKLHSSEITAQLQRIGQHFDDILLILDAPNECESPAKVVQDIGDLLEGLTCLRVFISSTSDMTLANLNRGHTAVRMSTLGVNGDIKEYLKASIQEDEQLRELPDRLKDLVLGKILQHADGSFRWADCQLSNLVQNATSESAVKRCLENLASNLEDLYIETLAGVAPQQTTLIRNALLWLVFAVRPLEINELSEAMVLSEDTVKVDSADRLLPGRAEAILASCRKLVNYDAFHNTVRLAHSSVRDFLLSDRCRLSRAGYFYLDHDTSLCDLTRLAVGYLNTKELETGYVVSMADYRERLARCPLLLYTAVVWPILSKRIKWRDRQIKERLQGAFRKFFDSSAKSRGGNFSSWIQVYEPQHISVSLNIQGGQPLSTPLYYAARSGLVGVAAIILQAYGKKMLEIPGGRTGSTPLHVAAYYRHSQMVGFLLEQGADPFERNGIGETGLMWARVFGDDKIVDLYLDYKARRLARNKPIAETADLPQ